MPQVTINITIPDLSDPETLREEIIQTFAKVLQEAPGAVDVSEVTPEPEAPHGEAGDDSAGLRACITVLEAALETERERVEKLMRQVADLSRERDETTGRLGIAEGEIAVLQERDHAKGAAFVVGVAWEMVASLSDVPDEPDRDDPEQVTAWRGWAWQVFDDFRRRLAFPRLTRENLRRRLVAYDRMDSVQVHGVEEDAGVCEALLRARYHAIVWEGLPEEDDTDHDTHQAVPYPLSTEPPPFGDEKCEATPHVAQSDAPVSSPARKGK